MSCGEDTTRKLYRLHLTDSRPEGSARGKCYPCSLFCLWRHQPPWVLSLGVRILLGLTEKSVLEGDRASCLVWHDSPRAASPGLRRNTTRRTNTRRSFSSLPISLVYHSLTSVLCTPGKQTGFPSKLTQSESEEGRRIGVFESCKCLRRSRLLGGCPHFRPFSVHVLHVYFSSFAFLLLL